MKNYNQKLNPSTVLIIFSKESGETPPPQPPGDENTRSRKAPQLRWSFSGLNPSTRPTPQKGQVWFNALIFDQILKVLVLAIVSRAWSNVHMF